MYVLSAKPCHLGSKGKLYKGTKRGATYVPRPASSPTEVVLKKNKGPRRGCAENAIVPRLK